MKINLTQQRVLVFAKAPVPGQVKTRMQPQLSPRSCASLHTTLIRHTLETAIASNLGAVELWCAPDSKHELFKKYVDAHPIKLQSQKGANLGARMYHALIISLQTAERVVLIGCDCPYIDKNYLTQAFAALAHDDVVIGPATDGGYVLIGAKRVKQTLFTDIPWGTEDVLAQTRAQLTASKLGYSELLTLDDIDTPGDLNKLCRDPRLGYLCENIPEICQ